MTNQLKPTIRISNAITGEVIDREMTDSEIQSRVIEQAQLEAAEEAANSFAALKASAKAKLIAGEPLTAAEADTLVI